MTAGGHRMENRQTQDAPFRGFDRLPVSHRCPPALENAQSAFPTFPQRRLFQYRDISTEPREGTFLSRLDTVRPRICGPAQGLVS